MPAGGLDPEKRVLTREFKAILETAIDALPDLYRPVFVLRAVEEMPYEEIARALGISLAATKVRIHRARLALADVRSD